MSSMFDELRNFWLRVEVVFAVCTSDAPEMRTACALSWHHLLGLRCMMVRGGLSMYKPDFRWEPQAAGLLARKGGKGGFIPHAAVPLVFSSLLKHHDHLSSHDFLSIFFFFLWCWGRNPGPHTNWASVLQLSYTPDLPVSICIPLKHLRAWLYSRNTILD